LQLFVEVSELRKVGISQLFMNVTLISDKKKRYTQSTFDTKHYFMTYFYAVISTIMSGVL